MEKKGELRANLEEEIGSLRMQVQEVMKANEDLYQNLNMSCHVIKETWNKMCTQVEVVQAENKLLKKQSWIQYTKA